MRFAYADPPYIGQAKRLYGKHPDFAGEVDHCKLIQDLCTNYDGWALSLSMKSLPTILPMCPPGVLTLAWIKPNTSPPMGDRRHYSWEPVILSGGRRPGPKTVWTHLVANVDQYTFRPKPDNYVVGAKPEAFCHWVFAHAGLNSTDTFIDLFPGSGAVARAWDSWCYPSVTDEPCDRCGGRGVVSATGRGSDGYEPCPACVARQEEP